MAAPSKPPDVSFHAQRKGLPSAINPTAITPAVPTISAHSSKPTVPGKDVKSNTKNPSSNEAKGPPNDDSAFAELKHATQEDSKTRKVQQLGQSNPRSTVESESSLETSLRRIEESIASKKRKESNNQVERRQRPGRLDIAAAKDAIKTDTEAAQWSSELKKPGTPSKVKKQNDSAALTTSQPQTPATAVSQHSESPAPRQNQLRTIRVVPKAKVENPPRPTAAAAAPPTAPNLAKSSPASKELSRQPSVASINHPGTPLSEVISDNASLTSTSISRPSSPPATKAGSAPVRQTTKSQQKKERQARAKVIDEARADDSAPAKVTQEESIQAPIIGRKKKVKKAATGGTAESTPVESRPASPGLTKAAEAEKEISASASNAEGLKKDVKKDVKDALQKGAERRLAEKTDERTSSKSSESPQKNPLAATTILSDLQRLGDVNLTTLEFFRNPAGINHRMDLSQAELADPYAIPSFSDGQFRSLHQGEAICVELGNDKRVVVLPNRQVLRGLGKEQARGYLDLRQRTLSSLGSAVYHPNSHGIDSYLYAPQPVSNFEANGVDPFAFALGTAGKYEYGNARDMASHASSQLPHNSSVLPASWGTGVDQGMSVEGQGASQSAMMTVEQAEQAMLAARKEAETLEKKLNVLVKKNRRFVFGSGH